LAREWSSIKNRDQLLSVGDQHLRAEVLDIIEYAIQASNPYAAVKSLVSREKAVLTIGGEVYDLNGLGNVYVIGAGKATYPIAVALEEILGDDLSDGLVVLKDGGSHGLQKIRTLTASHPIPDERSLNGALSVIELCRMAGKDDLVITAITGGSSSLIVYPAGEITLTDKVLVNKLLLESGASIREINSVRKHISKVKGGLLGLEIFPAEIVNLTVSDVVGDPIDFITDLTVPDTSTFLDAWAAMDAYGLWDQMPPRVCAHLLKGNEIETPKEYRGKYSTHVCVSSSHAANAAVQKCQEKGIRAHLMTTSLEGESRQCAREFVQEALAWIQHQNSEKPCVVIASGETAVSIRTKGGIGGPNQEFSLTAAMAIEGMEHVVVASVGTDGTDGPTNAAGGVVDGFTNQRARLNNIDPGYYLDFHNSNEFLARTGDLLITGPTDTNINDLIILYQVPE